MGNEWKTFLVTTKYVTDLTGTEHSYQIPPSWKSELLIWDLLEKSPEVQVSELVAVVNAFDVVSDAVALILQLPRDVKIEDLFDGGAIEKVFNEVWDSITTLPERLVQKAAKATSPGTVDEEFTLSSALALFAAECGWPPSQVLDLPKVQVMSLAAAISDYLAQSMRFQAAIHGIPLTEDVTEPTSSGATHPAQIDIEGQIRQFKMAGLPVEVI